MKYWMQCLTGIMIGELIGSFLVAKTLDKQLIDILLQLFIMTLFGSLGWMMAGYSKEMSKVRDERFWHDTAMMRPLRFLLFVVGFTLLSVVPIIWFNHFLACFMLAGMGGLFIGLGTDKRKRCEKD